MLLYSRRFSVQLIYSWLLMVFVIYNFFLAQVVWYQRHGAVLQIQGGTVSRRHDHINADKALPVFQICRFLIAFVLWVYQKGPRSF